MQGAACSEINDTCQVACAFSADADGDGHDALVCGGDDCDDNNPEVFPGNNEICDRDNIDEDCDATTFAGPSDDRDGDGYVSAACLR